MAKQLAPQAPATMTPTGPAAAAIIAAAIGCFLVGLMTTFAEISAGLKTFLTWNSGVGPLSGKTGVGVIGYVIAWFILSRMWGKKDVSLNTVYLWTVILLVAGLVMTFPIFFEMFAE